MKRNGLLLLTLAMLFVGCDKTTPPAKPPAIPVNAASPDVTPVAAQADENSESIQQDTAEAADAVAATAIVNEEDEEQKKHTRVMLLADSGPVLIDLLTTRGEQDIPEAFEAVIDELLQIARGDKESVSWKSLLEHPRFRDGQLGNPATGNYQAQVEMIRQYDTTQNDKVDRHEFIRYLTNNQSSRSISFFTSNDRVANRDQSSLAGWFDQDNDRKIGSSELATTSERLWLRDVNDDGILTPNEWNDSQANAGSMSSQRRRQSFAPKIAWLFEVDDEKQPWSDIRVAWETLYGAGQSVRREDLRRGARLFDAMDLDASNSLDNIEMEMLTEIEPDLVLHLDFAANPPNLNLLASRFPPDSVLAMIQHQSNRITLRFEDMTLDLFGASTADRNSQGGAQLDAFFQQADEDDDNQISPAEFSSAEGQPFNLSFEAVDTDSNGVLERKELESLFTQRDAINRNRLRIRGDTQPDALAAVLDVNADGRFDAKEIAIAPQSLAILDTNGDSNIGYSEIRHAYLLGIAAGAAVGQPQRTTDGSLTIPPVQRATSEVIPDWFVGMDRNDDQSISWREFVGTKQQFEQLDSDSDGFLDPHEATASLVTKDG